MSVPVSQPSSSHTSIEQQTNVQGNQFNIAGDSYQITGDSYQIAEGAHFHLHPPAHETVQDETNMFNLESCQQEIIHFYKEEMCHVNLLPWFDEEARNMDDIYVSLMLEIKGEVLQTNEDLVTIKTSHGTLAKRIFVKGTVGTGKSTLMAKLAYSWAQRNPISPLYQYDLVFLLSCREIQKGCSVVDAIFQQILAADTRVSKVALEKFIHSNETVLILLDGFDEYLDIEEGEIDAMLKFKSFRKTCVIVSSRPHKHFGRSQSLYSCVKLTGFSSQNVKLYLNKFFYNNCELVEALSRKLSESDQLKSLSHIPVMLMLICLLWEDSQSLPNTQSELYAEFTKFLWKKFCHRYNSNEDNFEQFLICLGKVAFNGLMPKGDLCREKLVFCETDFLDDFEQGCQVGLLTRERLRSKLTVSSTVSFLHKSFQEYCTSYYWSKMPDDQFDCVLQRIDTIDKVQNKFEILQFLCGTCDTDHAVRTIYHVIQVYLAKGTSDVSLCTETFILEHGLSIKPVLMLLLESDFPSGYVHLTESLGSLLAGGKNLLLYSGSTHWPAFVKSPLAPVLNEVKSVYFHENTLDEISETLVLMTNVDAVEIFPRCLAHANADSMNKLGSCVGGLKNLSTLCLLGDWSTADITPIMDSMSVHCKFQIKHFELSVFTCDDDILCNLLANQHHLQHLSLTNIKLNKGNMGSILDAIKAPLCELSLNSMYVGNAISHIKHIIPHLRRLRLTGTGMKVNDILTLFEFLPDAKHLSALNLSLNHVGKAVHKLGCVIPQLEQCSHLKTLELRGTGLTNEDASMMSENLKGVKIYV